MKKLLTATILMGLLSSQVIAGDTDLWLRAGGGIGFSDLNSSGEKHNNSHLFFGGIRPSYTSGDFEFSFSADLQRYIIKNDLKNHPTHYKAKHENDNVLLSISPKLILDEHWRIGPYLGHYVEKNHIRIDAGFQDVIGLEADYRIDKKWMTSLALEQNIDHGAKHRVAKLSIAFNFGEEKKVAPKVMAAPAPTCEESSIVVHFDFDKSIVSEDDKARIEDFAKGKDELSISAHTDLRGSNEYNDALAQRRADAVEAILGSKISESHVMGESQPIGDDHKSNRRVEIKHSCE